MHLTMADHALISHYAACTILALSFALALVQGWILAKGWRKLRGR